MKTIGKKIKTIYFLAVMAIVSICMAILPLMPTSAKADAQDLGLNVVGAQVTVIDGTTDEQNFDGKYAVSFQAEFTKELYEKLNVRGNTVKFGMLVGPVSNYEAITSIETATANGYVNSCFLGNKDCQQYVSFELGETTCKYQASIEYDEEVIVAGLEDAEKLNAVLAQSNQELTAIPYYVVNGDVTLVKADNPLVRTARRLINDAYALSELEFGDNLFARYVGTFDDEFSGREYYVENSTGKVYMSNANGELVPFYAQNFVEDGQLVVNLENTEAEDLDFLTLSDQTMDTLVVGQDYSIAAFLDDAENTVKTIKAKVVTKVISKLEDFFADINDDGIGDVARDNYIFKLEAVKNTYDGNHTTPDIIEGYYVLGANIDLANNVNLIPSYGDKRYVLNTSKSGFMATLDGRGFALYNVNLANCTSGMFGILNGATIKNVAFIDIVTNRNDANPSLLAHGSYNTTFENVYIKLKAYTGDYGDGYVSVPKVFGAISDKYGANSFTNVIYENTVALDENNTKKYNRVQFTGDMTSSYENTTVIGLPATYSRSSFEKVEITPETPEMVEEGETPEISKDEYYLANTLTLTLPLDAIESFVGADKGAGKYAIAEVETASTVFSALIARVEAEGTYDTNVDENKDEVVDYVKHYQTDIQFIEFVEDTARNYYVNNAGLAADADVVNAYVETGLWELDGDQLIWASSKANAHTYKEKEKVVKLCTYSYTIYECECGCGDTYTNDYIKPIHDYNKTVVNPTCTEKGSISAECSQCGDSYTIDIEPGHVYVVTVVPATCDTDGYTSYVCVCGDEIIQEVEAFGHTADENEEFCTVCGEFIGEATFYDQNEFIIDKFTGKVYRADANNELKPYDATSYLGEETVVTVGGVEQTLVGTTTFAFDKATLETLVDGKQYVITAGQNLLAARVVTKVFAELKDFFVDANASGAIEDGEMVPENYIFNIGIVGDNTADIKIEGYYVLANNIDVNKNAGFKPNSGENYPSNPSGDFGFQATLDGRGFAIQNAKPYNRAGIFGLLKNATIKNIAFTNMINDRNDGSTYYIAYHTINTTFENVYITAGENWLGWNQTYKTATAAIGGVSNCTFTNVVFENNAWKSTAQNIARSENSWFYLFDGANSTTSNVNSIGIPNVIKVEKYITVGGEDRHKLIMKLPLATIRKYVPVADLYARDDCGGAQDDFKSLINGINTGDGVNIQYIEFVEDTRHIGYYYDSVALAADTVVSETYLATGVWKVVEDALVWKSLTEKEHTYEAVVTDPTCTTEGYTTYTCSCGCGDSYISDFVDVRHDYEAVVTDPTCTEQGYTTYTCSICEDTYVDDYTDPRHTYDSVVTPPTCDTDGYTTYTCSICGDTYTGDEVPAGHDYTVVVTPPTCTEEGYTTHTCIHGDHEYVDGNVDALGHTPDASGDLCTVCGEVTHEGQVYEEGAEIVIDKTTGRVYKANENKELVVYDATSYLGEETLVTIGGVQQTVTNTTAFTFDKSGLANLADGQKCLIVAGQNLLVAQAVTKVLSTLEDFFVDANADGTVASDEMTRDNYIFNLKPQGSSGAGLPSIAIKGYYVLANNIDLKNNTALCNRSTTSGDHTIQIWSASDVGFRATLDGRGFALKNGSPSGSSAGMFGAFYGATVKNIAFDGFTNTAGNGTGLVLGYSYNSTFENVYIRLVGNNNGDNYAGEGSWNALAIADNHGGSKFNNLVVESFDGLASGKTNTHQRFAFTAHTTAGTFTNTAIVGMPVTYSKTVSATADPSKYVLPITMSKDAMTALGVNAGETQLSALPEAVSNAYANLIANIETRRSIDIDYINFVEDTKDRDYYLDNASLVADTAVANTFVATGFWKVVDNALVWASL